MDENRSPGSVSSGLNGNSQPTKQFAAGQIWLLSDQFYRYLYSYTRDTSAKYQGLHETFWRSQDLPQYVMIVREPDSTEARVSVMPLSPRIELVNELDLLLPASVSKLDRDTLIETWHTFFLPVSYLAYPAGIRFSYATYSLILDVGDTYYHFSTKLPAPEVTEAHGLQSKTVSVEQQCQIEQFREQEELWSSLLEIPTSEHYQYLREDLDIKIYLDLPINEPKDPNYIKISPINIPSKKPCRNNTPLLQTWFGRTPELKTLKKWIVEDCCKVVSISGSGGIGKSALAANLARQVEGNFNYVVWKSLRNAPKLQETARDIIEFLTEGRKSKDDDDTERASDQLLYYLTTYRCLVIFDDFDAVVEDEAKLSAQDDSYSRLLSNFQKANHQSCLVLTSRAEAEQMTSRSQLAQTLSLSGLPMDEGTAILKAEGIDSKKTALLSQYYDGNPLALKIAASMIKETFNNEIDQFLTSTEPEAGLEGILDQQFQQLSELEKVVLYWLAVNREAVSIEQLHHDVSQSLPRDDILSTLDSLDRRSLLEKSGEEYTIPPRIMEHVTDRLIKRICQEIQDRKIKLFNSHVLVKAQAKNYIQHCQKQKILQPILDQLETRYSSEALDDRLMQILDDLRTDFPRKAGYAASNVVAMLRHIRPDVLKRKNFSKLSLRQADFRSLDLSDTDLSFSDLEDAVFTKTLSSVLTIAFHPDGQRIATGDKSGNLRVWQIPDGELLTTYKHRAHHGGWLRSVSFSPDGKLLASAGDARTIRLWDIETGKCLRILLGHTDRVRSIAFSRDGRQLASASDDQTLKLWNVKTGECQHTFYGHTACVRFVMFSPDDRKIASTGDDQTIRLWDRGGTHDKALLGHTDIVFSIAFSPDGCFLASASSDRSIRLWNVQTGDCHIILKGHLHPIRSVTFSPDGTTIASGSQEGNLRLWNAATGEQIQVLKGHSSWVRALAFSPNSKLLASGSSDHTLKLWNPETGRCLRSLQGYACRVWSIEMHPEGRLLATANEDHKVRLWDAEGKCSATLSGHTGWVRSVHFSPDGKLLASGAHDQTVRIWTIKTHESIVLNGHTHRVRAVRFSPDGQILATGGHDKTIRFWNVETGRHITTLEGHQGCIRSLSFSTDGRLLASCSPDRSIRIWDVLAQTSLRVIADQMCRLSAVRFHPLERWVASAGEDEVVRLWDVQTGECLREFKGHRRWVQSIAFDVTGNYLVSGSEDQTVRVWNVQTGDYEAELVGHEDWIRSVVFSPDGTRVLSGGEDETVRVWDWRQKLGLEKLSNPKPYDRMNITGVAGLSNTEKIALVKLGAIDVDSCG